MHSRGFFIKLKKEDEVLNLSEGEIMESMPREVDYVNFETSLQEDVKWLTKSTKFKAEEVKREYVITNLEEEIKNFNDEHLKRVKRAYRMFIDKPNISNSYNLAAEAFDRFGFYFVVEWDVMPEQEFIEYYLESDKIKKFYIYKSFDYHY